MEGKSGEWDWEDEISTGFEQLVVQDKETGECWPVTKEKETFTPFDAVKSFCSSRPKGIGPWKVPKEYSLLGCGSPMKLETIQPVYDGVIKCLKFLITLSTIHLCFLSGGFRFTEWAADELDL